MKKAVAIPYVIALILGVVVVALLAYWFISTGGKGGGVGKEAECRGRILDWCVSGESAKKKAQDVCDSEQIKVAKDEGICKFCQTIIPTWDKSKIPGC